MAAPRLTDAVRDPVDVCEVGDGDGAVEAGGYTAAVRSHVRVRTASEWCQCSVQNLNFKVAHYVHLTVAETTVSSRDI